MDSVGRAGRNRLVSLFLALAGLLAFAAPAAARGQDAPEELLAPASYAGMTTYSCRTEAIPIYPGQNLNDFASTSTCPNAQVVSGPGDTSAFAPGSTAKGYITRFEPNMVEIKANGELVTPAVWDLHLHHVVWLAPGNGPVFAAGEEKTIASMPQGYGYEVEGGASWGINQMIHNLTASVGRSVYITWEIDWVPQTTPERTDIAPARIRWMDVAGFPQIYPVFDAERGFDLDGDGKYTFPDEVPVDPAAPGYEERPKISERQSWTVGAGGATLLFGAGHLHPGGLYVDLEVTRDGQTRQLFRSNARYYEPAGAVSWDVSMQATRREWRISLKPGDVVSIDATYDVRKASWYESMGIMPVAWTPADDPAARDPFDDAQAVQAMYDAGGILTHGRLPENIDERARKNLKLPDPRELRSKGRRVPKSGIAIEDFVYSRGGYSASKGFPKYRMRPPAIRPGKTVTFTNLDALPSMFQTEQVWHSITSCKAPCNRGSGIGYPLARGPIKFDSGQLGFGSGTSQEVTTGSNVYTTPPLTKPGKTYTYFCRIHPFMRGSIRVRDQERGK